MFWKTLFNIGHRIFFDRPGNLTPSSTRSITFLTYITKPNTFLMKEQEIVSRRSFIGSTALAGAAASFPYVAKGEALKSDTIRVAAIGLGGRGSGAIDQILSAPKDLEKSKGIKCNTKLVAVADAFAEGASVQKRLASFNMF